MAHLIGVYKYKGIRCHVYTSSEDRVQMCWYAICLSIPMDAFNFGLAIGNIEPIRERN